MFKDLADAQDLRTRIAGIDREDKVVAENVKKLVKTLAGDLNEFPPAILKELARSSLSRLTTRFLD